PLLFLYLHSFPTRRSSDLICAIRSIWRHRESLVQIAAIHTQHLQKALDQMNIQLHHVISDITGVTGLAIIDAILSGERDPNKLADRKSTRLNSSHVAISYA